VKVKQNALQAKDNFVRFNPEKFEFSENGRYIRFKEGVLSYEEFCRISNEYGERVEMLGHGIKLSGLRLDTFRRSPKCVKCGAVGTRFHLELGSVNDMSPHFNLYGRDAEGKELMFTKDHILPKSKGGRDSLENMQTMCTVCNCEKGNKIEGEE